MELNIVLGEPQIPQNTGNIARTCAVTGARLHIIKPMGFEPTDKQLKRAGLDYWHYLDISFYDGFEDFFAKVGGQCFFFTTKAQNRYTDVKYPDKCYIVWHFEIPQNGFHKCACTNCCQAFRCRYCVQMIAACKGILCNRFNRIRKDYFFDCIISKESMLPNCRYSISVKFSGNRYLCVTACVAFPSVTSYVKLPAVAADAGRGTRTRAESTDKMTIMDKAFSS